MKTIPEIRKRLTRFIGKQRKDVSNAHLTARETIEIANYISHLEKLIMYSYNMIIDGDTHNIDEVADMGELLEKFYEEE